MRKHKCLTHINVGRDGNVIFNLTAEQMRVKSYTKPKDPKTEKQVKDRNLHKELNLISAQTKNLRQFCYKGTPSYKNSHNAFIGLHKQFIRLARLDAKKVYENLHWSRGSRAGARSVTIERSSNHFSLCWHPGNMSALSDVDSQVIWVLRNVTHGYWEWKINAALRPDGQCDISLINGHYMDEYLLWVFFYNPKMKKFSVDKLVYIPKQETTIHQEFGGNNNTKWNLFEGIYEGVVFKRQQERIT